MRTIAWVGPLMRAGVAAALRSKGIAIDSQSMWGVVATRGSEPPAKPPALARWIWVPSSEPNAQGIRDAAQRGAYDVVVIRGLEGLPRLVRRLEEMSRVDTTPTPPPNFVAESAAAKALLVQLADAARTSQPVLLTGETGTGKELAARLIHDWSPRAQKAFVPINCGAIPNELMEGELFGYVKGSFSGAVHDYDGQVAGAEGGTVFFDEVSDTPLSLQMKLLRVLEDHMVSRLGENRFRKVNFRTVAATNEDLKALIAQKRFGADVYERLATVRINMPSLRERGDDLPLLVKHLLVRFAAEEPGREPVTSATPEALEVLRMHSWPGNVRELRNVIFGALVHKRAGAELLVSDLPRHLIEGSEEPAPLGMIQRDEVRARVRGGTMNLRVAKEELERVALVEALAHAQGNAAEAARLLGEVGRGASKDPGSTVRLMMRRLGVA